MTKTVIPGWMECSEKDDRGEDLTPLERFVLDNEPAGIGEETAFLAGLAAVLKPLNDEIARLQSIVRGKTFVTEDEPNALDAPSGIQGLPEARQGALSEPRAGCPHCHEVYEIWANTEGFTPKTAPESYQQRIIEQMRTAAEKGLR